MFFFKLANKEAINNNSACDIEHKKKDSNNIYSLQILHNL